MKSLPWFSASLSLLICFALTSVAPACAQAGGGIVAGNGATPGVVTIQGTIGPRGVLAQGQKGVPFSADIVNETTRELADGNRIHQETHGRIFRDSEGRTRNESENELWGSGEKRVHITISDPVQQVYIMLDPQAKTAIVHHYPQPGSLPAPSVATNPPAPATPQGRQSHISIKTEQLGTKEMEGFTVYGTRTSFTTEAGAIGNEKPIVIINESWMSRDFGRALLTITDDPQSGQHISRLVNIQAGEPDPLLFQVPPDYTVKENQ